MVFNQLKKDNIALIVDLEIEKVRKRLANKEISIEVSARAKEFLAREGYDVSLGARPLKRVIQRLILDPLSIKIVTSEISEGSRVLIDEKEGKIVFETPRLLPKMTAQERASARK